MKFKLFPILALLTISIARADSVYVAELYEPAYNHAGILKFDSSGGPGSLFTGSNLAAPNGLAFDNSSGLLYVCDFANNAIQRYDSSGTPALFANTGLNQPHVLAFDPSHNLYVANDANGAGYIEKFDSAGNGTLFATGLFQPQGITCDNSGNVYVSSWINSQTQLAILKYTPAGVRTTFVLWNQPGTHFGLPRGLAFFNNNIYCTDGSSLDRITLGGAVTVMSTNGLSNSIGVAVDSLGNCYVTDQQAGRVMKYDPAGNGSVFASGYDELGLTYVAVQVPEPAVVSIIAIGLAAFAWRKGRC
jgi:DNA-binding beta-propeller fold protein YncE